MTPKAIIDDLDLKPDAFTCLLQCKGLKDTAVVGLTVKRKNTNFHFIIGGEESFYRECVRSGFKSLQFIKDFPLFD